MKSKSLVLIVIVFILLLGNIVFMTKWMKSKNQINSTVSSTNDSKQTVQFLALFTEKVLMASGEVSFEDRIRLENDVRALKDGTILKGWEKFVESKTADEAQTNLRNLISILVKKIEVSTQ